MEQQAFRRELLLASGLLRDEDRQQAPPPAPKSAPPRPDRAQAPQVAAPPRGMPARPRP